MHVLDSLKCFGVRKYVPPVSLGAPPAAFKRTCHARPCPPAWNFTILSERRNLTNSLKARVAVKGNGTNVALAEIELFSNRIEIFESLFMFQQAVVYTFRNENINNKEFFYIFQVQNIQQMPLFCSCRLQIVPQK